MEKATLFGATLTRAQLGAIEVPPPQGPRHKPVPHLEMVEALEQGLRGLDLRITREQFNTAGQIKIGDRLYQGTDLYGVMDLERRDAPDTNHYGAYDEGPEGGGWQFSLGFRGSNARRCSLQARAGANIKVCGNGWFLGGESILSKMHTKRLNLDEVIRRSLEEFMSRMDDVRLDLERMQSIDLTDRDAEGIMFRMFSKEVLPLRYLRPMADLYFDPQPNMSDVKSRTLFGLQSAATRLLREEPVHTRTRHTVALANAVKDPVIIGRN